ncbi:MAG: response regulator, partial [Phenylobacterium sp.]|nr:response regulator [Phenylobacterium sp.]
SARALGELVSRACAPDIWTAPTTAKAMKLAAKVDPQLIFCELVAEKLDGAAFTRALRRSDLACRQAPVILVTEQADAAHILAGRDAGAHEFLRRPLTEKDLQRRLEAVMLHPRGWVEAVDYVGPDRRRFASADYPGPLNRLADQQAPPKGVRVGEALKIIRSALAAIDRDPPQALRALLAQTAVLQEAAAELSDPRLAGGAADLRRYIAESAEAGRPLDKAEAHRCAATLMALSSHDARAAA